jgi:hypothetical protein
MMNHSYCSRCMMTLDYALSLYARSCTTNP